jgi:hypothetical protein
MTRRSQESCEDGHRKQSLAEQPKTGSLIALPFDDVGAIDLPFGLPI